MKGVGKKVKSIIGFINICNPSEFISYRFDDFARECLFGDGENSKYLLDDEFLEINEKLKEITPSISYEDDDEDDFDEDYNDRNFLQNHYDDNDDNEGDFNFEELTDDEEKKEAIMYFSFGVFVFKCYIKHCLAVAKTNKNTLKKFCEKIEENYFDENFYSRIIEYNQYFKREGNEDIEADEIEEAVNVFKFFDKLISVKFAYRESDSEEDVEYMKDYIVSNYSFFIGALYLVFSNFLNYLNGLAIVE